MMASVPVWVTMTVTSPASTAPTLRPRRDDFCEPEIVATFSMTPLFAFRRLELRLQRDVGTATRFSTWLP
jgi:hypothetical protein